MGPLECPALPAFSEPAPDQRTQAGQLASDAAQAVILGELARAEELLLRATELDPHSVELAYQHARVLEDLLRPADAMDEYCRTIALGEGTDGIVDAQIRLDALYAAVRASLPEIARESFLNGLRLADSAIYDLALDAFTVSIDTAPNWPTPYYNRAIMLERLGRVPESLTDYRRYLQLSPGEIDPVIAAVTERIGMLEGLVNLPTPSPGASLALGVAFPGMGQYYTGRGLGGTVVLAAAAGAVAAGILFKEVTITCVTPSAGSCPDDEVVSRTSDRPYLLPAIGAAAAVTVAGAIEAFVKARGRRSEVEAIMAPGVAANGPRLSAPRLSARDGRVSLALLVVEF